MTRKGFRECPVCFEEIRAKALVCRFCGAVLTEQHLPSLISPQLAEAVEKERETYEAERKTRADVERGAPEPIARPPKPKEPRPKGLDALERTVGKEDLNAIISAHFSGARAEISASQQRRLQEFLEHPGDEYRTASVLFVDVSGYTALSEKLRTEYVKDVLDAFYEICTQAVDGNDGTIVKFEGDACLAVFGAPVAYDRDVEACVRAALRIREQVRCFPLIEETRIQVSTGIETGEILTSFVTREGKQDFDIFGPTVNLAKHIQSAAGKDTILVGPFAWEQVKGVFEFRKKRARKLKNVAKPVVTYEILGERADRIERRDISRPFVAREKERRTKVLLSRVERRDFSTPFVGREKERRTMESLWETFFRERGRSEPSAGYRGVRLTGIPGIGKSRLAEEFLEGRKDACTILRSESCHQDMRVPFGLWRLGLCRLWRGGPEDSPDKTRRNLDFWIGKLEIGPDLPALKAMFGLPEALEQMASLGPAALKRLMLAELRSFLLALARERPLVLFLDDLQWADPSSVEILDSLGTPPGLPSVFLILSHRPEFRVRGEHVRSLPSLHLKPLEAKNRDALLGHLVSLEELGPEIREALAERATGNPLFLVEMLRCVMDDLTKAGRDLKGKELADRIRESVPGNLKGLLQSRIDLLDQRRRLTLQCGAVLGQRFAYRLIELFDMIRDGLMARLYALKGLEFLEEVKSAAELEFLFRHHLIRETAYGSLLQRQRRELHRFAAERMELTFKNRLSDLYPVLAYHFERGDDPERALHYLHLAGDRAFEQAATLEAIEFYESALKRLWKDGEPEEKQQERAGRILRRKGILHRLAGENAESLACFERGRNLPVFRGNRIRQAEFAAEIGTTFLKQSDYQSGRRELEDALRKTQNLKDPGLRAQILNALGTCAWEEGKLAEARKFYDRTLKTPITKDLQTIHADARNNLALLDWRGGRLERARDHFRVALSLYQRIGQPFGVALALMNLGIIEENMGRFAQARRCYRLSLERGERIHFMQLQCAVHANLGNLALVCERFSEAMEHNAQSRVLAERIGDRRSEAIALENLTLGHIGLRQFQEAKASLREARKIAREIADQERKVSLDLAEIELRLAEHDGRGSRHGLGRVESALQVAQKEIEENGYLAELPRLWRLYAAAYGQGGREPEMRDALKKALEECARQKNRSEERRIKTLQKQIRIRG